MKVRRYNGSSLEKIREVIQKEFGDNAVIVNTKKITKPGLIPGRSSVTYEVIAAVDEAVDADNLESLGTTVSSGAIEELLETQKNQYRGLRSSMQRLDEKLAELDGRMDSLNNRTDPNFERTELTNVHEEWREEMIESVRNLTNGKEPTALDWMEALATLIPTAGGIMFRKTEGTPPDVYVLSGPTGVGKTTTLAKLAAKCVLGQNLNVGLLTIDTFRVAAVDQLREYANLLGIEMQVAFSPEELSKHISRFADKDVVFIDTPGRSQFDDFGINSIRECIAAQSDLSVLLTVPVNVRKEDAESIYQNYKALDPVALVLTKSDETTKCDGLTTLFDKSGLPVIYVTMGQRVPEDIKEAAPGLIASLILPETSKSVVAKKEAVNE